MLWRRAETMLVVFGVLCAPAVASAQVPEEVRTEVRAAIVRIDASDCDGREEGTSHGFVVRHDKDKLYVVATMHGVAACRHISLARAGDKLPWVNFQNAKAEQIRFLRSADLALIPLEAKTVPPMIRALNWESDLRAADVTGTVWALGFHDDSETYTDKPLVVRSMDRTRHRLQDYVGSEAAKGIKAAGFDSLNGVNIVLFDGNLSRGSSGMPVVDEHQRLVGVVQGGLDLGYSGTAWAIEAPEVAKLFAAHDPPPTPAEIKRLVALGLFARPSKVLGQQYFMHRMLLGQLGSGGTYAAGSGLGPTIKAGLQYFGEVSPLGGGFPQAAWGLGVALGYEARFSEFSYTAPDGRALETESVVRHSPFAEGLVGVRFNRLGRVPVQVESGVRGGAVIDSSGHGTWRWWWGVPLHVRWGLVPVQESFVLFGLALSLLLDRLPSADYQYTWDGGAKPTSDAEWNFTGLLQLYLSWELF